MKTLGKMLCEARITQQMTQEMLANAEDDMAELTPAMELNDRIQCGICGKKYRRKMARLGTPYAAPI